MYNITGSSSGNSVNGNNFSVTILEKLNVSLNCSSCTITTGKSKITINNEQTIVPTCPYILIKGDGVSSVKFKAVTLASE